ncbi:MAG: Trm112 family protein [Elusimicrobia bacterium]|nr:Trm112 family protein [Elusimicrobiota bacterium]
MIDPELLKVLACPECKKPVLEEQALLCCVGCGRRFPIRDGIPVMLVQESPPK